jgi:hypothetical protein
MQQTDGTTEVYSGALKAAPLQKFLDGFAADKPIKKPASSNDGQSGDKKRPGGFKGQEDLDKLWAVPIADLTAANVTDLDEDASMWLLAVYSAAEGERAASHLR